MITEAELTCAICGAVFVGHKTRKTCGDACRQKRKLANYSRAKSREYAERGPVYVPKVAEKACSRCRVVKLRSEYHLNKHQPDGLQQLCKDCRRAHAQKPDVAKQDAERKARWYAGRAEEQSVIMKERYEANRDRHNADSRARYHANKEVMAEKHKAAYERSKTLVRRVCQCGRGYFVKPNSGRYFCSVVCRRTTRWGVAAFIVQTLAKSGTSIHSLRTMADAAEAAA